VAEGICAYRQYDDCNLIINLCLLSLLLLLCTAGLNMLNTTNLDYFAAHHQAEIFRLKALFMAEPGMNDLDGANSALSTALCLWRQCPDAWLSWGQLCDARYEADPTVGDM
jgi:hypothetical protein